MSTVTSWFPEIERSSSHGAVLTSDCSSSLEPSSSLACSSFFSENLSSNESLSSRRTSYENAFFESLTAYHIDRSTGSWDDQIDSRLKTSSPSSHILTSKLCERCLLFEDLYLRPLLPSPGGTSPPKFQLLHHATWKDLRDSALSGCELCKVLRNGCLHSHRQRLRASASTKTEQIETLFEDVKNLVIRSSGETAASNDNADCLVGFNGLNKNPRTQWRNHVYNWSLVTYCDRSGDHPQVDADFILGNNDDDGPHLTHGGFDGRCCSRTPDLSLAQKWIWECQHFDKECVFRHVPNPFLQTELPTRLVRIEKGSNRVWLQPTESEQQYEYATLSHVWGGTNTPSTTKDNLDVRIHNGIKTSELPATFRDAITVTDALGYCFLWIDSLCIVQDDKTDWEHECPRMASIYQGSVVTLAGPMAKDSHAGLLHGRMLLDDTSDMYQTPLQYRNEHGESQSLLTMYYPGFRDHTKKIYPYKTENNSVLLRRAWIFQESLLSRRTLNFGSTQMYLDCRRGTRYEMSHQGEGFGLRQRPQYLSFTERQPGEYYSWWRRGVKKYSRCELTFFSDRLPAISGIVHRLPPPIPDQYVAGLWRNDLQRSLLWYNGEGRSPGCQSDSPMKAQYLGPSWSWVSLPTPITYPDPIHTENAPLLWSMETIFASTSPDGADPYGRVKDARLILRGKTAPAVIALFENNTPSKGTLFISPIVQSKSSFNKAHFFPDDPRRFHSVPLVNGVGDLFWDSFGGRTSTYPQSCDHECVILFLAAIVELDSCGIAYALVLEPGGKAHDVFRRIGLAVIRIRQEDLIWWHSDCEETDVAII